MAMGSVPGPDLTAQRQRMVESQLRGRGIRHPGVLEVMGRIPRELFLPPEDRARAYVDGPQAIGHGATISQPFIVALMTEAVDPGPEDRVLEIGTGSGYQTAILAELSAEVFTVEFHPELSERARGVLGELDCANITFRAGDGRSGWREAAPFDCVLVTAAPARIPAALLDQLGPGGRLVAPVGVHEQKLMLHRREPTEVTSRLLTYVRFVPLLGEEGPDERT